MQIVVTFRHMETDEAIRGYIRDKMKRFKKYTENPREVHVVISPEKFRFKVEGTALGDGASLNSQGRSSDLYAAIDQMVDKMERQIRERREKLRRKRSNVFSLKEVDRRSEVASEEEGEDESLSSL